MTWATKTRDKRYRAMRKRDLRILRTEYAYVGEHSGSSGTLKRFCADRVRMIGRILAER